jgi:hypothetical protein
MHRDILRLEWGKMGHVNEGFVRGAGRKKTAAALSRGGFS